MTTATTTPPASGTPDAERYVTHRAFMTMLGTALVTFVTLASAFAVWVLGAARAEAQVPLARVATVEEARKADAALARENTAQILGRIEAIRTEVRTENAATRTKVDDLIFLIATGKLRPAEARSQARTSLRDPP